MEISQRLLNWIAWKYVVSMVSRGSIPVTLWSSVFFQGPPAGQCLQWNISNLQDFRGQDLVLTFTFPREGNLSTLVIIACWGQHLFESNAADRGFLQSFIYFVASCGEKKQRKSYKDIKPVLLFTFYNFSHLRLSWLHLTHGHIAKIDFKKLKHVGKIKVKLLSFVINIFV